MVLASAPRRPLAALRPRSTPWSTVLAMATLMAYADGFVLVSVQGAVGAIERAQSPFATWLTTSTLLLPVYVLAVLVALALARRRLAPALGSGRRVPATALLVVVAGTLVAFAAVVASAVYDYHLQTEQLTRTSHLHSDHAGDAGPCVGLCDQLARTRQIDERAARYATATDLAVNVVVVGWVVALRGGRLEIGADRASRPGTTHPYLWAHPRVAALRGRGPRTPPSCGYQPVARRGSVSGVGGHLSSTARTTPCTLPTAAASTGLRTPAASAPCRRTDEVPCPPSSA